MLFIFDNRIEIVSPGHLPNNLTVAKIRAGNSIIRNPILVSYIAKGLLPYRGLGSGIKRALEDWPEIDFTDDREGCLFTATVHRKEVLGAMESEISSEIVESSPKGSLINSPKTEDKIIALIRQDAAISTDQLGGSLGISKRAVLKADQETRVLCFDMAGTAPM